MRVMQRVMALVLMSFLATFPLQAQTFGGQAVDSRSGEPLVALQVRLLEHRGGLAVPAIVDSTRTDERGLFEFRVAVGGVYQAEFGPWGTPYSLGTVDTVRDDRLLRRYVVPVPRPAAAQPMLDSARRAAAALPTSVVTLPARPSLARAAVLTTFGAALGAGAGYLVADLRCGRSRGCDPASSYPYYPGGATLGAALGSGLSEAAAACRYGFLRGLAGSVLGSLAGSLLAGDSAARAHIGSTVGAPIGGMLVLSTCRMGRER